MLTLTGQVLAGKYRVGARLGGGGMGEVYEAVQEGLGRRVAIKVMSGPMASDPQLLERFQREARAVAALGHPHIVQVTDFQDNPGEPPFLVMERLVGESLGELLERQPMIEPPRACRIAEQTLSALSAAHETGLVHRDVKPDNIFLCKSDTGSEIVKLLDFGVAKAMEETQHGKLTSTGAIVGTLVYMAPEQARGEAIDARADVYALGACLYHMLAGQPPFNAPNAARLLSMVCSEPVPALGALRPDLDPNLVNIVMRAMAHYAQQRYPSARAMMSAIGSYLRGEAPGLIPASGGPGTDPMSVTALAGSDGLRTGPASPPYGMPPPSTGPQHYVLPTPTPTPGSPPPMYMHPGSGGGVVVPPYAIAPSAPPPRSGGKIVLGFGIAMIALGGSFAGVMWWMAKHHKPTTVAATATTAPPAVSLVVESTQGGDLSSLTPVDSAAQVIAPPPLHTNATTLNTAPTSGPANPALSGMSTAQLVGEMSRAYQRGEGKACLDAYDKLRAQPDFSDPANGYAMMRGGCLMEAGRCDEGRKIMRDYYNEPRPVMQQLTPQQVDQTVSSMAQMYCPPSQLGPGERVQRAQMLLYRSQSSKDTAAAARYADEMAAQLPMLPRGSQDERRKVSSYEYGIAKAYGDAGRCADASKHFHSQCTLNGSSNVDACANGLLRSTAGCKPTP